MIEDEYGWVEDEYGWGPVGQIIDDPDAIEGYPRPGILRGISDVGPTAHEVTVLRKYPDRSIARIQWPGGFEHNVNIGRVSYPDDPNGLVE